MGRTFQYQGVTRNFAAIPPPNAATIEWKSDAEIPLRVGKRQPWVNPAVTFTAAAVPPLDLDPIKRPRSQLTMMPTRKKFQAEHFQIQSGDDIFPSMPMPQRAYTCVELPTKNIRRFTATMQSVETGWSSVNVPMPVWERWGAEPLPMKGKVVGAAHFQFVSFDSPSVLPIPVQVYSPNELPKYSRSVGRDLLGVGNNTLWFATTLFNGATFSEQEQPRAIKNKPIVHGSSIFLRDFVQPRFCWSQVSEPVRLRLAKPHEIDPCEAVMFKTTAGPITFHPFDYSPPKVRRDVVPSPQTFTIRTNINPTFPGSWTYNPHVPTPHASSHVWLIQSVVREPRVGPIDGGEPGGSTGDACPIELVGYDNTTAELIGYDMTSGSEGTAELTGTDNTIVNLTGEC